MQALKKIVIVGGGTSGWIAAATLVSQFNPDVCSIEVVESKDIDTIGVGESTIPPFIQLLRNLDIDERDFIQKTSASFKLGIQFCDWKQKGESYFHPFGEIGRPFGVINFYDGWLKAHNDGKAGGLQQYAPASVMAKRGRFALPEQAGSTELRNASYALHIDAKRAAEYFRQVSVDRGVVRTEGTVTNVIQRENGGIDHLILSSGDRVDADFFIDCTGFYSLLIEKTLGVKHESWEEYLACDRAIAVQTETVEAPNPFTQSTAKDAGWTWKIPLQNRVGNGYVYSSRFISDDEAHHQLMQSIQGDIIVPPKLIPFRTGVREMPWKENCLSLGLATGFIEPLESTAIHLVVRSMDLFLRFFPTKNLEPELINEYNRRIRMDYQEIRDFIILHYCATQRNDTAFWQWCKTQPLPQELKERIQLFSARGVLRDGVDELFSNVSWYSVFEGMDIRPQSVCPRVDHLDQHALYSSLKKYIDHVNDATAKCLTHADFLKKNCPSVCV